MIEVILTRLKSVHQNLRSDEIRGTADGLPAVGRGFAIIGAPINENAFARLVATTAVKEIRHHPKNGSLEFWTANSHYGLQILDMDTSSTVN